MSAISNTGVPLSTIASRASDFTGSIGVNTHLNDILSPYGQITAVVSDLTYLGISNVRDTNAYEWTVTSYVALANAGIKLDLVVTHNPGEELGNGGLQADQRLVDRIASAAPGAIIGLEGQNEPDGFPDTWNGASTTSWTVVGLVQGATYAALKSDPLLAATPVLNASVNTWSFPDASATMAAAADLGNVHLYPFSGNQPQSLMRTMLADQQQIVAAKPAWITEFGYSNTPGDASYGVDSNTQAKNTLNGLLDAFKLGVRKTFLYELLDERSNIPSNAPWAAFGLFNASGSAKPVATAIHNLMAAMNDGGSAATTFKTGSLNLSIPGLPPTANSMLLQKSDGSWIVALWNEAADWDARTQSELAAAPVVVTVNFGTSFTSAALVDPTVGLNPIVSYSNVSGVKLSLSDHPILLEIANKTLAPPTFTAADQSCAAIAVDSQDNYTGNEFSCTEIPDDSRYDSAGQAYVGPVTYVTREFGWSGTDAQAVRANVGNAYLHGGAGDDAIQVTAGSNVVDGGSGSNFLTGASGEDGGSDTFFVDLRGNEMTWDTLVNFHEGDALTLWGFEPGVSAWHWDGVSGAGDYGGATLCANVHGTEATEVRVTFAATTMAQAERFQLTTGSIDGFSYLYTKNIGA